jgi:hypothetical protein
LQVVAAQLRGLRHGATPLEIGLDALSSLAKSALFVPDQTANAPGRGKMVTR